MKKTYLLLLIGVIMSTMIGCETIKGIGKDVSAVGGWLTRGSEKAQNPDAGK